ncbi:MAG: T9SS type A sorting domain-containing protein [Fimbriimonadaceae bacterium]|nr:T9SS type A sorting domain-containing protein [Chitinophagales bacterium]
MKNLFLFSFSIFVHQLLVAQIIPPAIEWQIAIGGTGSDEVVSIKQTNDGGYIVGGTSNSNSSVYKSENSLGEKDYWIAKLDSNGNIEWENTIGGDGSDELTLIEQTNDGGYIVGGNSQSGISGDKSESCWGDYDFWVIKLDSEGNIEWDNTIGGNSYDFLYSIQQTDDGGYILGGDTQSGISGDKTEENTGIESWRSDYWVVKLDNTGNIEWQNTIGGNREDYLRSAAQTPDGGYILGGYSKSGSSGDKTEPQYGFDWSHDYWIIKIDNAGNIEWQNTLSAGNDDYLKIVQALPDGRYFVAGSSRSREGGDKSEDRINEYSDMWVLLLDASGNIIWDNTIGTSGTDDIEYAQYTSDGGFIITTSAASSISYDKTVAGYGSSDGWVIKLDENGDIQWQDAYGGTSGDGISYFHENTDGSYILGGYSYSSVGGNKTVDNLGSSDYWILKLAPETYTIYFFADTDGDGYGDPDDVIESETQPEGYIANNLDCDDSNENINPSAIEICNDIDDNCDGNTDEELLINYYADIDNDGFGNPLNILNDCFPPYGYVLNNYDCDDANININPDAIEICNLIDDNCDGKIDVFNPEVEWQVQYGGTDYESAVSMDNTSDGGFILTGSTSSYNGDVTGLHGDRDYWLVKLDENGSLEWQRCYGGNYGDIPRNVFQNSEGGYILTGFTYSTNGDVTGLHGEDDCWVIKTDEAGNILWKKCYGGTKGDYGDAAIETSDGNYLIAAESYSKNMDVVSSNLKNELWIIKVDRDNGDIIWQHTYGSDKYDYNSRVIETSDHHYLITGSIAEASGDVSSEFPGSYDDAWFVLIDTLGNIIWENTYGGSVTDIINDVIQTDDGDFIAAGYTSSNDFDVSGNHGDRDYWILKIDNTGNIKWQKCIGGPDRDEAQSISKTIDGGFIIAGFASDAGGDVTENFGNYDQWIVKINAEGELLWERSFAKLSVQYTTDIAFDVVQTTDKGYAFCGYFGYDDNVKTNFSLTKVYSDNIIYYADHDNDGFGNILDDSIAITPPCGYVANNLDCDDTNALVNILNASITPSGSTTICNGSNLILNATTGTGYTYKWYKNGILVPPATSASMIITKAGNYKVEISNGTCSDISEAITVTVNPKPNATINNVDVTNDICVDASIRLKANSGAGFSYQWYKGVVALAVATSNIYFATTIGNYKVKITNSFGCEKVSAAYSIINSCKLSDDETDLLFNIYPNPNSGEFTLQISELIEEEIIYINIKNMLGEEIYSENISLNFETDHHINLNKNIAAGMYIIEISTADEIFTRQIIISK